MNGKSFIFFMVFSGLPTGLSGQMHLVLSVNQPPKLEVSDLSEVTTTPGESVTLGQSLVVSGGLGEYNYQWQPAEFLDDNVSIHPEATVYETSTFTLKVNDGNGCSDSTQQVVNVEINSTGSLGPLENIRIYPVPAHDEIGIEFPAGLNLSMIRYVLIDVKGIPVLELTRESLQSQKDILKLNHLPSGFYTLIIDADKNTVSRGIILY